MSKFLKKISVYIIGATSLLIGLAPLTAYGSDFLADMAGPLLSEGGWGDERAYNIDGVSDANSLVDNIKAIFYPEDNSGGAFWDLLKNILVGVLILMFVWTGAQLLFYANDQEEVNKNLLALFYIVLGTIIVYAMLWLLGDAIDLGSLSGLSGSEDSIVQKAESSIFLIALAAMKGIAFFMAIVFLVYYGYQMITAFDKADKQSAAKKGMINVITALIFVKVIDYIYFMALQPDLKDRAISFVVEVSKFLGYFMGVAVVILIVYAGFRMITANGDAEQAKKAQNTVRTVFVAFIVLMLFLLIIYQILNDVVGT